MSSLVYNVDIGYSTQQPWGITSDSDILWTDYDRPLVILEIPNIQYSDQVIGTIYDLDIQDKLYRYVENIIGESVDSMYGQVVTQWERLSGEIYPGDGQEAAYSTMVGAFPSLLKPYPNSIELLKNKTIYGNYHTAVIKFKSLNRLYCVSFFSYDGLGNFTRYIYDSNTFSILTYGDGTSFNYPQIFALRGGVTGNSYSKLFAMLGVVDREKPITYENNVFKVGIGAKYRSSFDVYVSVEKVNVASGSSLHALFGDGSLIPDREISGGPYGPGGDSEEGTLPPGTFDGTSDPIPDSSLPTLSAANTGFTRIYNPTLSQVQDLARYLWTEPSVIDTIWNHIKQFFEDPMQAIIGFNLVPCRVPDAGNKSFSVMFIDTGVVMNVAASQFVDVDCGSVKLDRFYGSALDQSPYTRISCFLPYIGTVQLDTDEVMGTTLSVKYRIDIVSGSCVAKVFIDGNCLYQYSGHCAITIPISSADFSSYVSAAISVAKLAVEAASAGVAGIAAGMVGDASQNTGNSITSTRTTTTTETVRNPATGRQITAGTRTEVTTTEKPVSESTTQASFAGLSPKNIANTVGDVMSSKPIIGHSGSFSGNSGYLGVRRPFLIIERPNMCLPADYGHFNGYPCMITLKLGDCSGYTRVQQVQLTGTTATNPEQAEILELLKMGVIL